ncbi:uncharacterized protein RHOBADRAFT_33221 [Rhodotorula graminis WP1]|uniref:AAA+ ATPase domain-containing protein n=1 Tax=Rhodotorula graminis (strain WP1) TaxID=578459 RepID=A0A194SFY1_RHOGW|nr:uncharacterized protein RHOBADRAFT_33221 [Rhodotorula graminis WP1]KPV78531.1 hypothetical protein RHOBADRAFT_33221 [Rhodotorula graminis WP1]
MDSLLDLPLITLSNGQTRRARILRALLAKPELVILEEPFTGLDVASRAHLATLLASLHAARSPRVLLVLRPQDVLPPFVTHARALFAAGERLRAASARRAEERKAAGERAARQQQVGQARRKLVELRAVNVSYGRPDEGQVERRILRDVDWTVREGERWLLAGHNGSGKSTLLALVLGDHPRAFNEDVTLFDKPRYRQATATLQQNIGHVSPEIFNAFPRKHGPDALSAYEAIVTGFESVYSYRRATPEQAAVLDEPFSGMDKLTVDKATRFLDDKLDQTQAVILITHFEEEVPRSVNRVLRLEEGAVVERI